VKSKIVKAAFVVLMVSALSACTGGDQEELSAWMQRERNSIKPDVKPIPEPSKFEPYSYGGERFVEPFSNEKLASILKSGQSLPNEKSALIEPELNRRKQPLEAFPLDTMKMVGSLNRKGQLVGLVKVYQVTRDNYLGQNFGRILKIEENQIVLREIVQDAAGEWIERPAALQLQEESTK
jgi:type IV pilus assembly protein PilP